MSCLGFKLERVSEKKLVRFHEISQGISHEFSWWNFTQKWLWNVMKFDMKFHHEILLWNFIRTLVKARYKVMVIRREISLSCHLVNIHGMEKETTSTELIFSHKKGNVLAFMYVIYSSLSEVRRFHDMCTRLWFPYITPFWWKQCFEVGWFV